MENEAHWSRAAVASFLILIAVPLAFPLLFPLRDELTPIAGRSLSLDMVVFLTLPMLGLALGIYALISMRSAAVRQRGQWLAIAGILANSAYVVLMLPAVFPRSHGLGVICPSNLKQISTALITYSQDYDGYLPPPEQWNESMFPYAKSSSLLICPVAGSDQPSYALNRSLIGLDLRKLRNPGDIVMAFDSEPGKNRVGGSEIASFRHSDGCNVAFADGHVKWFDKSMAQDAIARKPKLSTSSHAPSD